jgi:IS4 transposase
MARSETIVPGKALATFVTREKVEQHARELGVVRRERKTDVFALVWALVLGFQVGAERTLEALRHAYQKAAGHGLVRSAFYTRLSPRLAEMLRRLALDTMERQAAGAAAPRGYLAGFRELLAMDATVLRLRELLAGTYAASRTNHTKAAAKLHAVVNAIDGSPRHLKLTPERVHDTAPWQRVGRWLEGSLVLFDLGYYSFQLFDRIDQNGGFFLTRLKVSSNPLITAAHRCWRGQSVPVEGRRLRDVLPLLERQVLDVEINVSFRRRAYRGKRTTATRPLRLIAIRNDITGEYHCYLTNVPPERLAAEDVTKTYALRWQVEIFFKAMKQHGHLDHLPSEKRCVVECLVWASVLAVVASQVLYRLVRDATEPGRLVPPLRWAALFSRIAAGLVALILDDDPERDTALGDILLRDAPDPNRNRSNLALSPVTCGSPQASG